MNIAFLTLLRSDAQRWWWHDKLRRRGQTDDARKLERDAIRMDVDILRMPEPIEHSHYGNYVRFGKVLHGGLSRRESISNIAPGLWCAMHVRWGWACGEEENS